MLNREPGTQVPVIGTISSQKRKGKHVVMDNKKKPNANVDSIQQDAGEFTNPIVPNTCLHLNTVEINVSRLKCLDCKKEAKLISTFDRKSGDLRQYIRIWE